MHGPRRQSRKSFHPSSTIVGLIQVIQNRITVCYAISSVSPFGLALIIELNVRSVFCLLHCAIWMPTCCLRYPTRAMATRADYSRNFNGYEDVCCRFQTVCGASSAAFVDPSVMPSEKSEDLWRFWRILGWMQDRHLQECQSRTAWNDARSERMCTASPLVCTGLKYLR